MDFLNVDAWPGWVDHIQWPAMAATLVAAFLVGSHSARLRLWGFGLFVVSNVLWVIWGLPEGAWALIVLQAGLFLLNARGAKQNEPEAEEEAQSGETVAHALKEEILGEDDEPEASGRPAVVAGS
jgi:hypothetical protein